MSYAVDKCSESQRVLMLWFFSVLVAASTANPVLSQGSGKLKELFKERLVTATRVHELALKGYVGGAKNSPASQVQEAKTKLLTAQIDLAQKNEELIKVYGKALQDASE